MTQLALLALADAEVDLLTRLAARSDLTVRAVYHPDPHSLVARLAELADVPVFTDLKALAELHLDGCLGHERSRPLIEAMAGPAAAAGRLAPWFVPIDAADRFLRDPAAWERSDTGADSDPVVAAHPAPVIGRMVESPPPDTTGAAGPDDWMLRDDARAADDDDEDDDEDFDDPAIEAPEADDDRYDTDAVAMRPAATAPMPTPPAATPLAPAPPAATPLAATPPAASREKPSVAPEPAPALRRTLGAPTIDLFYDPARLAEWLAVSAIRFSGADASVLWRRELEGRRWSLMAFAPGADRLPAVTFPPEDLEGQVQAGILHTGPLGDGSGVGVDPPVRVLYLPLPGADAPFGLLALFQPWHAPDWPRSVRDELTSRAVELGHALERCVQMTRVGQELKHLKFKEKIRDLLLDDAAPAADRWRRCLEFLLLELPAESAWYFAAGASPDRLELVAAVSTAGPIEGHLSMPIGTGLIGRAFAGRVTSSWFCESEEQVGEVVTIPVEGGRGGHREPVGVLLIEGLPPADETARESGRRVDLLREILAPLVPPAPGE